MLDKFQGTKSMRKLDMFLEYSCHGYALLVIDDISIAHEMEAYIAEKKSTHVYDFEQIVYGNLLWDINYEPLEEVLIFSNFSKDRKKTIDNMERFNLGRDLILSKTNCCFFILPTFAASYVFHELPNLFDYFQLKESFILKD